MMKFDETFEQHADDSADGEMKQHHALWRDDKGRSEEKTNEKAKFGKSTRVPMQGEPHGSGFVFRCAKVLVFRSGGGST